MKERSELFQELKKLATEQRNPASMDIDARSVQEILTIINGEDTKVAMAVEAEIPYIAKAVELVVESFQNGGRLLYVGAGTSGRVGIVDAAECPPTFGTDPEMVQGIIAGGEKAVFRAQEGAEDDEGSGVRDLEGRNVTSKDVVCGVAASRMTPYVVAAVRGAKRLGARTIFITTNPRSEFNYDFVDVAICPEVGPEVIMGSTRMKSGTAQKLVLNMITTTAMIKLGKVYENMMIDLQMNSRKLEERAKGVVMTITGVSYEEAARVLQGAGGHVKKALVMTRAGVSAAEAEKRLKKSQGFVRAAIEGNFS
ncbi:MAG: N-acetylmuramic acid 6-phosphate etherase [Bacteroidota bacterium]